MDWPTPNFDKLFEVNCDALNLGIRDILILEGYLMLFFNVKLMSFKNNYYIYIYI